MVPGFSLQIKAKPKEIYGAMFAHELRDRLSHGDPILVLDVREPWEWKIASLGGVLIPLDQLPKRFRDLDSEQEIVCLCHHGVRSAQAVGFLRSKGFKNVQNVLGGIEAWSLTVDSSVVRYT